MPKVTYQKLDWFYNPRRRRAFRRLANGQDAIRRFNTATPEQHEAGIVGLAMRLDVIREQC